METPVVGCSISELMRLRSNKEKEKEYSPLKFQYDGAPKFKIEKSIRPRCIICKTKKGKGSKVLETDLKFHHTVPNQTEYKTILKDLGAT
jgi:predicted transcriptional regulator